MTSKTEGADLILKLYDLRREALMREARDWFIGFNPESLQEILDVMYGKHSARYRMVVSYWDMAAALVNHGAIDEEMFNDANGEHLVVFAKVEPFLAEIRETNGSPKYLSQLEDLVMRVAGIEERLPKIRERFKQLAAKRAAAAGEQTGAA